MSSLYSQLYVASKILKSSPNNMEFALGNCHEVTVKKKYDFSSNIHVF